MARPKVYDAELRMRLIDAAAEAIAAQGVDGLSVRAVSAAAGTTTNAVYTIFGSREALVGAVAARADDSFTRSQREARRHEDPIADLARLARAYRQWAFDNPALYAVIFGGRVEYALRPRPGFHASPLPAGTVRGEDGMPESIRPLFDIVTELCVTGVFRGLPPWSIAWSIWASVHGVIALELAFPTEQTADERLVAYLEHCEATLRGWLAVTPDAPCLFVAEFRGWTDTSPTHG